MEFPETLEDDGQANDTLGPYLSAVIPNEVLPDQNSSVNPLGMPLDSGNTGNTSVGGITGITLENGNAGITGNTGNTAENGESETDLYPAESAGVIPKTLKIPASTYYAIERVWDDRGFSSLHAYCLSVLAQHNAVFEGATKIDQHQKTIAKLTEDYLDLQQKFAAYQAQASHYQEQLTENLSTLNQDNLRLKSELQQQRTATPTPSPQTVYQQLATEGNEEQHARIAQLEQALTQYAQLVQVYNTLVFQVCKLASAESSRTPEFFFNYFEQLSSPKHQA